MAAISPPAPADAPVVKPVRRRRRFLDGLYPYGYIAPSLAFMVVASFFPILFTIYMSMTNYSEAHDLNFSFIGLDNFVKIFTVFQPQAFLGVFEWTVIFAAVTTALNFGGGLVLAYLLNNENMWERNLYRTILIVPWALPGTIAILAWGGILQNFTGGGMINTILVNVFHVPSIPFLGDPFWARFSVLLVNFWLGYPFMMTACLGALQSIPPDVHEAAEIDGANGFQKFFRVTFPLLRTASLPLVIATFAYNLNNFGVVYLLTGGGPVTSVTAGATDILPTYTYSVAYTLHEWGLACAYGILIFFIIGTLSSINMRLSGAFQEVD